MGTKLPGGMGLILGTRWKIAIIAIALAATLTISGLFLSGWFSGDATDGMSPSTTMLKTDSSNGVIFTFFPWSRETTWDQVRIYVSDGVHVRSWAPATRDFSGSSGGPGTLVLENMSLGKRAVACEIHDVYNNGFINKGDSLVISGTVGLYLMTLVYEPNDFAVYGDWFRLGI